MTVDEVILRVSDLVIASGDPGEPTILVHGVSFDVVRGEVLCIVGESGSGKSLTVLAIMGLLPDGVWVHSGSIEYAGRNLAVAEERELRRLRGKEISMVFQDPLTALNPLRRVGDQVSEAVRLHDRSSSRSRSRSRAVELLDSVGVAEPARRARSYPHQWSGGMRQRAVIAMAIAHDPALIIADEPTTALDVTVQAQVMRVLADVRRRAGSSLILITHDLGLAAGVADRMHILWRGRTVEVGTVYDIFDRPEHSYTKRLLASVLSPLTVRGSAVAPAAPVADDRKET
ncbi:MAG: peptide/nickel transport system ATP-binding protein [Subtercola sp.]|nr:peptide/nickel transport system ATP-binding protein [Subtercola sp.]